jgi:hypothetical protein
MTSTALIEAARLRLEQERDEAAARNKAARAPHAHLVNSIGMLPDEIRNRPDIKEADRAYWRAHYALAEFNTRFKPKKQSLEERMKARQAQKQEGIKTCG